MLEAPSSVPQVMQTPLLDMQTPSLSFIAGVGEMGDRIRAFDWAGTPLGPVESWSPALRMMIPFLLANRFPLLLWWGPQYVSIYNDPYIPVLGTKHPRALGQPVGECWKEIWHLLKPLIDTPFHGGPATWNEDILLEINRHGFVEETHFTIAYSPVPDETMPSGIGGVLATVHEITEQVIGERRVVALGDLGAQAADAKTGEEACRLAAKTLAAHDKDVPFALLYLIDTDGKRARLAGRAGLGDGLGCPPLVELGRDEEEPCLLTEVIRMETMQVVGDLATRFGQPLTPGPWADPPREAVLVPIRSNIAHQLAGVLVAGVSPRLKLDGLYRSFYELIAGQIATAVANARAYEEESRRAEALAELDRAKTAFFSNVSHEFRTPLTLILGPLEDALANAHGVLPKGAAADLAVAHRNSLRLLKLVNTLLDFSRIEAGRIQASYEPTDLAACTADLVSVFRSAIEKAGLELVVDFPSLPEAIYVDREMWEKIVLNLLSNAFKFTFEGKIKVTLRWCGERVELWVSDTGVGIPEPELPKIFERFHRVRGARSRTHEGTGIGLALVQELVRLHGGEITVRSQEGHGTAFTISIPSGSRHLPPERIGAERTLASTSRGAAPYVEEALRWLPQPSDQTFPISPGLPGPGLPGVQSTSPRILLAEDNADMRDYLRRLLLSQGYEVLPFPDGQAALEAARLQKPDLILSDIMMPLLDGVQLLCAIREDEALRSTPVILLSARSGEEARLEGIQHGADDYLTKPFSARELLARVSTNLKLAGIRQQAAEEVSRSQQFLERIATAVPDLLFVYDIIEGRNLYANRSLETVLGYTIKAFQSIPGNLAETVVHPDDLTATKKWYSRFDTASDGEVLELKQRVCRADGSYRWLCVRATLFERAADGRAKKIIGVASDITDKQRVEDELHVSQDQLAKELAATRHLQELSTVLIQEGKIDAVYHQLLDSTAAVVQSDMASLQILDEGRNALCVLASKGFNEAFNKTFELIGSDGRTARCVAVRSGHRVVVPDVEKRDFIVGTPSLEDYRRIGIRAFQSTPLISRNGRVIGMISTHWRNAHEPAERELRLMDVIARQAADIMERVQTEMARGKLVSIIEFSDDAILSKDLNGIITSWNRGAERLFGYSEREAVGQPVTMLIPPDRANEEPVILERIRKGEPVEHYETIRRRKDGRLINVSLTVSPIKDAAGKVIGASKIARDITESKNAEKALREVQLRRAGELEQLVAERTAKLQSAVAELEHFSYTITYDMRAPLRALQGFGGILMEESRERLTPEGADYLRRIIDGANRLDSLIQDSLQYARIVRNRIPLAPVESSGVLRGILESYPNLQIPHTDIQIAEPLPPVIANAAGLGQCFSNLLANAIKFVKPGQAPHVRVWAETRGDFVRFWFEDNGIGIPPEYHERIFDMFQQLDKSYEGTGIGLALVRKTAERMEGKVGVESEPGKGSRFWLELKRADLQSRSPSIHPTGAPC